MRRSTPHARFAPGFVNGCQRSAPIPPIFSDVVRAISEFVANAVEHGYTTEVSGGGVVEASLAGDGNLHASVIDRGQWEDYREGEQGRGRALAMAEAEVSRAVVTRGDYGTTCQERQFQGRQSGTQTGTFASKPNPRHIAVAMTEISSPNVSPRASVGVSMANAPQVKK